MRKRLGRRARRMQFHVPVPGRTPPPAASDTACLSAGERAVVAMMRQVFIGFADESDSGWGEARRLGEVAFDPLISAGLIEALGAFLAALRESRRSAFRFSDPRCPCCRERLTEPEGRIVALIRASRRRRSADVMTQAMVLCEGVCDRRMVDAAGRIGAWLDRAEAPRRLN